MIRKTTIWLVGIAVLVLALWDVLAFVFGKNATISVVITDWSYYTPWVPFVLGFLCGHLFAPAQGTKD
jgi:hypothetical protein